MSVDTARLVSSTLLDPTYWEDEEQDEPLAGQEHRFTIDALYHALNTRLGGETCFVAAELRVHRDPLDLRDYREPDVLVALGVADRVRERYVIAEEGKAPDLVIEVLSPSSAENQDLTVKRTWYRREGVHEYVVLDPSGDFSPEPRLQAWRLGARQDGSGDLHRQAGAGETLWSELIPFGWRLVADEVRVVDRATGEVLPTPKESELGRLAAERETRAALARAWDADALAEQAREQAEQAREQARAAEARAADLEAELTRLRRMLDERQ
jgi:Uma2 family endonuclease